MPPPEMLNMDLAEMCRQASGKPLQPVLYQIGIPREQLNGGPLFTHILKAVADKAEPSRLSPAGFSVIPWILLSAPQLRILEKELGRDLCDSGDVIFGAMRIARVDSDEELLNMIYRDLRAGTYEGIIDMRGMNRREL